MIRSAGSLCRRMRSKHKWDVPCCTCTAASASKVTAVVTFCAAAKNWPFQGKVLARSTAGHTQPYRIAMNRVWTPIRYPLA